MKSILLILLLLTMPSLAFGQSPLAGIWRADITPPGTSTFTFDFQIHQEADSLRMTMGEGENQLVMEEVSYGDEQLRFVMPMHGGVACTLARKEDELFAGVCVGQMGESVATMKRKQEAPKVRE